MKCGYDWLVLWLGWQRSGFLHSAAVRSKCHIVGWASRLRWHFIGGIEAVFWCAGEGVVSAVVASELFEEEASGSLL